MLDKIRMAFMSNKLLRYDTFTLVRKLWFTINRSFWRFFTIREKIYFNDCSQRYIKSLITSISNNQKIEKSLFLNNKFRSVKFQAEQLIHDKYHSWKTSLLGWGKQFFLMTFFYNSSFSITSWLSHSLVKVHFDKCSRASCAVWNSTP